LAWRSEPRLGVAYLHDGENRTTSSRFETSTRSHRAIRAGLPGQTSQPCKGSGSYPAGGEDRSTARCIWRDWLPGYPAWLDVCPGAALWENTSAKDIFAKLRNNSITVPGEEVNALSEAARDLKIAIVIGASERVDAGPGNGTIYNSLVTISEDGHLRNHHRKLVPTYTERLSGEMVMAAD